MATFSSDSDALQLTPSEKANLLRLLERRASGTSVPAERRVQRHSYDPAVAPLVEIMGPKGGPGQAFVVNGRNLSAGGLAFLHGAPLAIDTPCTVTLFDRNGTPKQVRGKIVRCRKVAGRIHELGISFAEKIELERFVQERSQPAKAPPPEPQSAPSGENPTVAGLAAAVAKLRALDDAGWPGNSVRTVLAEIEMLAALAMKSVPEAGENSRPG